ncbi:unnamed protein product [Linum tenue]|uniref:Uncharacterized protein n=2 Tax=Linum tenue TaxID=586396 RepID=A0AAV0RSC2_9ROSI|nr:unnamed protein product [Linum tenue]
MVLLIQKINKLYSKLENHYHHHKQQQQALRTALQSFRSQVSSSFTKLLLTPKPGLEISLQWVHNCFELLPVVNKAFAKLVMDLDHPMSKWAQGSVREYLSQSLSLLDLLNSISSSLSSLGQSRLSFSHALALIDGSPSSALDRLKTTQLSSSCNKVTYREENGDVDGKVASLCEREAIIHEALMEMKTVGFWVTSILVACLSGDAKAYLETRRPISVAVLASVDSVVSGIVMEKGIVAKEVRDLNESAVKVAAEISSNRGGCGVAAEEMERKLEVFEELLDGLRKDVDRLFSEILVGRNELLRRFRHGEQY